MKLNKLETIVISPGKYKTRDGKDVLVHEIKQPRPYPCTEFLVKGILAFKKPGNTRITKRFGIWHVSGRYDIFKEHPLDIVEKINK